MTGKQKFSRGLSMPPNGWPLAQYCDAVEYFLRHDCGDFNPEQRAELVEACQKVRAKAAKDVTPYGTAFTVNNK
ncbi:hypothetical protein D3C80_518750 [compost metagenome]